MSVVHLIWLILVIVSIGALMLSTTSNRPKCRIISGIANILLMALVAWMNFRTGSMIWFWICIGIGFLDFIVLGYDITTLINEREEARRNNISLNSSRRILRKFIREIEDYGSKRH
jgi:hypothetical protein